MEGIGCGQESKAVRGSSPSSCNSGATAAGVAWPMAVVDSIRIGNPTSGLWKSVGLVLGTTLVVAVVGCAASRSCYWGE